MNAFTPQCKVVLATNYRPEIKGTDLGIWRRVKLIPFSVTISPKNRDPDLLAKLAKERPGILNWALAGLRRYLAEGQITEPQAVSDSTTTYRSEMDLLGDFIGAEFELDDGASVPAGEMCRKYAEWCEANGEQAVTQRTLGTMLTERGFRRDMRKIGGKPVRLYLGLKLLGKPF